MLEDISASIERPPPQILLAVFGEGGFGVPRQGGGHSRSGDAGRADQSVEVGVSHLKLHSELHITPPSRLKRVCRVRLLDRPAVVPLNQHEAGIIDGSWQDNRSGGWATFVGSLEDLPKRRPQSKRKDDLIRLVCRLHFMIVPSDRYITVCPWPDLDHFIRRPTGEDVFHHTSG